MPLLKTNLDKKSSADIAVMGIELTGSVLVGTFPTPPANVKLVKVTGPKTGVLLGYLSDPTKFRDVKLRTDQIRLGDMDDAGRSRYDQTVQRLEACLRWLRVVNDRKLSPEIMRRHIDFIRNETRADYTVVVVDSLHKLPFKDISQKRSGIDGWLRQLEAIRDELGAGFLVISELERKDGQFEQHPQLGSFKGSGDIGYSADNAMVLSTR